MVSGSSLEITEALRASLKTEMKRTNAGPARLLQTAKDVPPGLTSSLVRGWIVGSVATAKYTHLNYALNRWRTLPTWKYQSLGSQSRDPIRKNRSSDINSNQISDNFLDSLRYYKDLGFVPGRVLKGAKDIPEGLSEFTISRWLSGSSKTAPNEFADYVLQKCQELERSPQRLVTITGDIQQDLRREKERTDVGARSLFQQFNEIPEGLTHQMVQNWLTKKSTCGRKDHVDFILKNWRLLPSAMAPPTDFNFHGDL